MTALIQYIYVTQEAAASHEPDALVWGNVDIVNACLDNYFAEDELCHPALLSYFVDYFLVQMENGGFAQFVYNTGNNAAIQAYVSAGLQAMQATQHLALFEQAAEVLQALSEQDLHRFLEGEALEDAAQQQVLEQFDEAFSALNATTELRQLNNAWLKAHPQLKAVTLEELQMALQAAQQQIPNLAERQQQAMDNAPEYVKTIQRLCEAHGMELEEITAGDPEFMFEGQEHLAWFFITDKGIFSMVEIAEPSYRAVLLDEEGQVVLELRE